MKELLTILDAMLGAKGAVSDPMELLLDVGDRIVKSVSSEFSARSDEVAILLLTRDGDHLRFVAPRKFVQLATIPVSKRDAIAVTVLRRKVGDVNNSVPTVRHVSFFETIKIKDRAAPIQKMITVPILDGSEPLGVAQISRKGDSPGSAGPDFSPSDLTRAQELFTALAPRLRDARPESF
jgi:hypothetical protein